MAAGEKKRENCGQRKECEESVYKRKLTSKLFNKAAQYKPI